MRLLQAEKCVFLGSVVSTSNLHFLTKRDGFPSVRRGGRAWLVEKLHERVQQTVFLDGRGRQSCGSVGPPASDASARRGEWQKVDFDNLQKG